MANSHSETTCERIASNPNTQHSYPSLKLGHEVKFASCDETHNDAIMDSHEFFARLNTYCIDCKKRGYSMQYNLQTDEA